MGLADNQFQPSGKGFILAKLGQGLPSMRRLVDTYIGADHKTYVKLDGEITPLLPEHVFLSGT